MDQNELTVVMSATMNKIKELVDTNTVVGKAIHTDDGITLKVVPFPETDKYRKLVEQNKSIYHELYFPYG